ncbi:orotidine-5'-phosphate decarboxylase [Patescibacteria group bacterium]|nr:orotidine-5'-phosphate decarboxylase [Patescibacteria group bacterium]
MNPIITKLREIIAAKKSNLTVAADISSAEKILELAEKIGDKICVLKTHVDILDDFTSEFPKKLREIADRKNFLIFEDRKFADIGNTVSLQFSGGIYKIAEWADLINAHSIVGEGIVDGLRKVNKKSGLILLAQMTPEGNLFTEDYALKTVEIAKANSDFVVGFIGSSDKPEILRKIRQVAGDDFMIFTPGIKLAAGCDDLGQTYNTPEKAIQAGTDVIIVGRGIIAAEDPSLEAEKYRAAGWEANLKFKI